MSIKVTVEEAASNLEALLDRACKEDQPIMLTRDDRVVARLMTQRSDRASALRTLRTIREGIPKSPTSEILASTHVGRR